jgi:hypothetical protein
MRVKVRFAKISNGFARMAGVLLVPSWLLSGGLFFPKAVSLIHAIRLYWPQGT